MRILREKNVSNIKLKSFNKVFFLLFEKLHLVFESFKPLSTLCKISLNIIFFTISFIIVINKKINIITKIN